MTDAARPRPKLAVWKFASCDGCQLTLLNCEDELLALAGAVEIAYFPEATRAVVDGPYDLSLVEGSVTTADDAARIQEVRRSSRRLVTIGACATAGGIQALRNFADVAEFRAAVYAQPEYIETLATSTPIAAHVDVDFELRGCPIDRAQLLEVLAAFLQRRRPRIPARASAWSASAAATSASRSRTARPAWGRSPTPAAARCARRTTAAATAASGPRTPPTPASLAGRLRDARDARARRAPGVPDLQRGVARLRRGERAAPDRRREVRRDAQGRRAADASCTVETLARVEGEGAMRVRDHATGGSPTSSCGSTSRRGSSRPSCADAGTRSRRTSPPGSAASARSPTR